MSETKMTFLNKTFSDIGKVFAYLINTKSLQQQNYSLKNICKNNRNKTF